VRCGEVGLKQTNIQRNDDKDVSPSAGGNSEKLFVALPLPFLLPLLYEVETAWGEGESWRPPRLPEAKAVILPFLST